MAGIFDIFTGNAQSDAQQNARDFLQDIRSETGAQLSEGMNTGLGMLQGAVVPSLDALRSGYAGAGDVYNAYTNNAYDQLYGAQTNAASALQHELANATDSLRQGGARAVEAWDPVSAAAGRFGDERALAAAMSQSGLGLTDPSVARNAFRTSPGYEFMLNEGLESIARNANRAGMLASGNQMRESQTYGSGLADKEWDDWMNRLMGREQLYAPLELQGRTAAGQGVSQAELATAAGLANQYGAAGRSLADLIAQTGRSVANVGTQQGRDLAQMRAQLGQGEANIFGTNAQQQADFLRQLLGLSTQANIGLAGGQAQTFIGQGDAEAQSSANIFNTALGLARLGLGSGGLGGLLGGGGNSTDARDALV